MKETPEKALETAVAVELGTVPNNGTLSPRRPSDSEAVVKIGLTPTVPRTLDRLISLIGLNSAVVCPWPTFYFVSVLNLANGGTAGLLVGTIIACVFMGPVYVSLAEKIRRLVIFLAVVLDMNICSQADAESVQVSDRRR